MLISFMSEPKKIIWTINLILWKLNFARNSISTHLNANSTQPQLIFNSASSKLQLNIILISTSFSTQPYFNLSLKSTSALISTST